MDGEGRGHGVKVRRRGARDLGLRKLITLSGN